MRHGRFEGDRCDERATPSKRPRVDAGGIGRSCGFKRPLCGPDRTCPSVDERDCAGAVGERSPSRSWRTDQTRAGTRLKSRGRQVAVGRLRFGDATATTPSLACSGVPVFRGPDREPRERRWPIASKRFQPLPYVAKRYFRPALLVALIRQTKPKRIARGKMPLVFDAKPDSGYDDHPGERYHFPNRYLLTARGGIGDCRVGGDVAIPTPHR